MSKPSAVCYIDMLGSVLPEMLRAASRTTLAMIRTLRGARLATKELSTQLTKHETPVSCYEQASLYPAEHSRSFTVVLSVAGVGT